MMEQLESRQLLSAALADGVLTVTASSGDDEIFIKAERSQVRVVLNGQSAVFDRALVTKIAVFGGDGNDHILLRNISVGALLVGGAGGDTISAGLADDTLIGGSGLDYLFGRDGSDIFEGGEGRDRLIGGAGDDIAIPRLDRLSSIEKDPTTVLVERSFPAIYPDPVFGVIQNNDGTTTLQVRFYFSEGGQTVFFTQPRIDGNLIDLDSTILMWSGGVTEALNPQTREFNLGHLSHGVSYTVRLGQWNGTVKTTTLNDATSNPLPPPSAITGRLLVSNR